MIIPGRERRQQLLDVRPRKHLRLLLAPKRQMLAESDRPGGCCALC
jgi:hypothetical protein